MAVEDRLESAEVDRLAADLRAACVGDVRFDRYTRIGYATDGSIYSAEPAGVVFPRDVDDVRAAVAVAANHDAPVLPRGAGSSLAGQAVGPGCVVLDLSRHMDEILEVDPDARLARVQPGVVQDDLDDHLAEWGLQFAPDPASSNRATIGGGIGNNSTGAHSVRYGITDAYVEECRVVLADGSLIHTREVVLDGEEFERIVAKDDREAALYRTVRAVVEDNEAEIEDRYPELKRCVSGYNLQKVIREREDGECVINLSKLLVGAEGTLGVVVCATLSLVTRPAETALAVYCYDDLIEALAAVPAALELEASAVELMDREVFRLADDSQEYAEYAEAIPDGTAAALMLEFDSELHDDLSDALEIATEALLVEGDAFEAVPAFEPETQDRLWKLRKAAIPLLMSMDGDPKPYPFVEDASVPPDELATYVEGFQEILEAHDTTAAYFAHAGVGTLHIRPVLNLKDEDGVETMRSIADDVTDLALEHGGSFSGEHGDGLARTEFNPKLYGPDLWDAFKAVKSAFDPNWRMNPGKVVYRDDDSAAGSSDGPTDMRDHLRYGPDYYSLEPTTTLEFEAEGGFSHLVELCNGCGTCRQTGTDVMCPTYRASKEELATTRGRANLLRAAISGDLDPEELYADEFQQRVLDLCIGCKGCASDCPTGVDLAKLKAEVKHGYHEREGVSLRERLFANVDRLAAVGAAFAPLTNYAASAPGARTALERTVGIAPDRTLPTFRAESLVSWFADRGSGVSESAATDRVVLYPDTYTNYSNLGPGRAAVEVLEAADVHVAIPDLGPTGRAAYSQGLLDRAAERGQALLDDLESSLEAGWSVVFLEPSDASMVVDEYGSLLSDPRVETLSANVYGVCEYLDRHRLDSDLAFDAPDAALAVHGHCHQKALGRDHHAVAVLRRAGYTVDPLDTGCCGMAGSFGYEREHYDLSRAIGRLLLEHVDDSDAETVVAPGVSCRTQIGDFESYERPRHPIEALADALAHGG
ncbi:FAD-binding and (Fe-S)-binding domain-containing protein [Natrialbaceae archaeon AArc-T1-2]|uniref:FAD-binding and (Fe-S)-binding domain-containing protein n=1 Tax=Natrialbaceae archaeon AArc-T1-2 TaxID=3053904 RepID=UPI00255B103C|nr:FAD-binding and (Fe-S)-binding domain-containing protein [Natrialbaceae archaeon AArc-T1-2]WIV67690.1 FAD-linked oxidase C-terminal domain-containing protein [Natrialbaceae archaeon AArc-T1-2]